MFLPLDPLEGVGYQFWSGIGTTVFVPLVYYWHHTCHVPRCWRIGHNHEGRPVCRKHR